MLYQSHRSFPTDAYVEEMVNASIDKSVEVAVQGGSRAGTSNQRESGKGKGIKLEGEAMETTKGTFLIISKWFGVELILNILKNKLICNINSETTKNPAPHGFYEEEN